MRRTLAVAATAALAWGLAASSSRPVRWHGENAAELRLSWSARPERIEECRRLSDEELAARPAHMRQRVECEGRSATYSLEVMIDGRVVDRAVVRGGGLRHDRPIILLRDYAAAVGPREIRVTFTRREEGASADSVGDASEGAAMNDREAREALQRRGRRLAALPPRLEFARVVDFHAGRVALVTVENGALIMRGQ